MGAREGIVMDQQTLERVRKAVNDFGGMIKDYREKKVLTLESLASRIDCSASYIFRAERGSKIVPIHMRVRILAKGLNWKASEIEYFLVETVREYERKKG
ncbi:helix-turn-helix domain-containing protein [Lederbergia panacisoli]|uniref:helix-turn-helix domain-containing protein n=1 Tax=Lederbergia panacisoli TaxID=1255251 RepID=UPI00214ABC47|nr:helix-turn-helix transcriptional regulator [Lederbergia panacisoli]MCR2822751.1 helix-turn-helix domain-containing protein [Lederbergia panacisoli]